MEKFNSVWLPVSVANPDGAANPPLRFWRINPDALDQPQLHSMPQVPIFFPFRNPFPPNKGVVMMLPETMWSVLRCLNKNGDFKNWPKMRKDKRTLLVTLENGEVGVFAFSDDYNDRSAFWVDSWDSWFLDGQTWAASTPIQGPWTQVNNVDYEKRKSGVWPAGGIDTRKLESQSDGIGFVLRGSGGEPPVLTENYVKLCPFSSGWQEGKAELLLIGDPPARTARGINPDEMYIPSSVMDRLRGAEGSPPYPFKQLAYSVALRNAAGEIGYVRCLPGTQTTETGFWKQAYDEGVKHTEWKFARWRNVDGLDLCFVITGTRTTAEYLKQVIAEVLRDSIVPIKQRAIVTSLADKPLEYNWFLSRSPFNDFDTWIRESDYISYLQDYGGYDLPTKAEVESMTNTITNMLASRKQSDDNVGQEMKRRKLYDSRLLDKGVTVDTVSFESISAAARRGARKSVPGQRQQMGGSATDVAVVAGWPNPRARIKGKGVWGSPGVFPAEWLHRCAFSWGNIDDIKFPQSTYNLIFGSSEANSLMTRYEKAWQLLFTKERKLSEVRGSKELRPYEGTLRTANTPDDEAIVTVSVSGDKSSVRTVIVRKGDKGQPPTAVDKGQSVKPDQGGDWPDYWAAARECRNLSWCLTYEMTINQTGWLELSTLPPQIFYPFQRGFYTLLEAKVDCLLLDNLEWQLLSSPAMLSSSADGLETRMKILSLNYSANSLQQQSQAAEVWASAREGNTVTVGGVILTNPGVATLDPAGRLLRVPFGHGPTLVAQEPLSEARGLGSARGNMAPTLPYQESDVAAARALVNDVDGDIPSEFVLQGTVKLFGLFDAPMYAFHGSAPEGTRQIVPIQGGVIDTISSLMPSLADSGYGSAILLNNTELIYNQFPTATSRAGTWIETDVSFSGPLQPINSALQTVFHQTAPIIRVQAFLSSQNNWSDPISPGGLALRGTLPDIDVKLGDVARITRLGVNVGLAQSRQPWPPFETEWKHAIGFFGSLELSMPQDMAPVTASFSILETQGVLTLMASVQDDAGDPSGFCGIQGLKLSQLAMQATLGLDADASSVSGFTVSAELILRDSTLQLWGYYTEADWSLTCSLDNFTYNDLRHMYQDLFGVALNETSHDIKFDSLCFVANPSGLTISGGVTIEGHSAATATIAISKLGIEITGSVEDVVVDREIVLKSASLDVFVGRQDASGAPFRFAIQGSVGLMGGDISASMFLGQDDTGQTLWTIVGGFQGAFRLSVLAPALRGTFLDLAVQGATLIASNVDGVAAAGAAIPAAYQVVKGVQVAGILEPIAALNGALRGSQVTGLTLQAIYSADSSSYEVSILLPSPRQLCMKGGTVYSGPISVLVQASTSPTLAINAEFFVKVPNQAAPLKFDGGFSASMDEAKLFIELANQWWQNPFGLSPQLKLGPDLALQIGIVYGGPVYPSEIGIAAGLAVGEVSGTAAMSISDAPNDELIMLHIENLGIRDLVRFAGALLEEKLPVPSDEFLLFKDLEFYLSSGTTIGTVVYPPGASFNCDAVLWGHDATVYCSVQRGPDQIKVSGSLQPLDIGPVSVSGYTAGTPARLDVQFGPQQQNVMIDGGVSLFDLETKMLVKATIMPSPIFQLQTELAFTPKMTFELQADMRPGTFSGDLQGLDFDVHAIFQQDILDYIAIQIQTQTAVAMKAADDGIDTAEQALDKAKAQYKADIDEAQQQVDEARRAYENKLNNAETALSNEKKTAEQKREELSAAVDKAFQEFNAAVTAAEQKLAETRDESAKQIRAAQQKLQDAQTKADQDISKAQYDLNNAEADMSRQFGDAIAKIQSAENDVNSLQGQVDAAQEAVNDAQNALNNAPWYDKLGPWLNWVAQQTGLEALKLALNVALGVLEAAKAIVSSAGYVAAQAAIDACKKVLEGAQDAADSFIHAAQGFLQATQNAEDAAVKEAETQLEATESPDSPVHKALTAAKAALDGFENAEVKTLQALQDGLDAVGKSAEAVAFDTAKAALAVAEANMKDIDAAKAALQVVDKATDAVLSVAGWVASHAVNVLDVKKIEVSGDLRAACLGDAQLSASIMGAFAGNEVDFSVGFTPGEGADMAKNVFSTLIDDVKQGVIKIEG